MRDITSFFTAFEKVKHVVCVIDSEDLTFFSSLFGGKSMASGAGLNLSVPCYRRR